MEFETLLLSGYLLLNFIISACEKVSVVSFLLKFARRWLEFLYYLLLLRFCYDFLREFSDVVRYTAPIYAALSRLFDRDCMLSVSSLVIF